MTRVKPDQRAAARQGPRRLQPREATQELALERCEASAIQGPWPPTVARATTKRLSSGPGKGAAGATASAPPAPSQRGTRRRACLASSPSRAPPREGAAKVGRAGGGSLRGSSPHPTRNKGGLGGR